MLRSLSTLESFYVDQAVTIITVSDLEGIVNSLTLQKAIDAVVMMHPLLSSEILQSDEGYSFSKRENSEDKLTTLGQIDKDKRKEFILSELNSPLTKTSLIRFTLLLEERIGIIKSQHISLVTTTHHAVSDGMSCVALHEQIWKVYAELASYQPPTITDFPLMPAIENLIPTQYTEAELSNYIERYQKMAASYHPFVVKAVEQGEAAVEMSYVRKKFTLKQTKAIIENCKKHHVSVHGALCAANLLALKELYGKEGNLDLSCHSPIDVRARLEPAVSNNAMFSAAIGCGHVETVTPETTLWALGENISTTIKNHIESGDIFKSMLTYKEMRLKSKLACSIGITNVGVVNLPPKFGKLKLTALTLIPRIPLPMLTASAITSGDKLTITYPYAKPFYSGNVIKKIAEQAATYLLTL